MRAGRRKHLCTKVLHGGRRCGHVAMRFAKTCRFHTRGKERDRVDDLREQDILSRIGRGANPILPATANRALELIRSRRIRRAWKHDRTLPGSTLTLSAQDERRISKWLASLGFDLNVPFRTPAGRDSLLWIGVKGLSGKLTPANAAQYATAQDRMDRACWVDGERRARKDRK